LLNVTSETILALAEAARKTSPAREDVQLAALQDAIVGSPVMVCSPTGEPAHWLVPFLVGDLVCGYVNVTLKGQVMQISALGGSPQDRQSWIPLSFVKHPPDEYLAEIRRKYPERQLSTPVFSYDRSPARWAWYLELVSPPMPAKIVLISPAGWYERRSGTAESDWEG
jgi:hypothetical protein